MNHNRVLLDHGSGGKLTNELLEELFFPAFSASPAQMPPDSALLQPTGGHLAFTTDSFVIKPIFFPGGDIGKLAVCGTLNDLAVTGATPLYLSCGFILEEGLDLDELKSIVSSMAQEAGKAGVSIVTGDTKVVGHGECDKIFINTSGIGRVKEELKDLSQGQRIEPGDKIIINGTVADHGMAVLGKRNQLDIGSDILSDCANLHELISSLTQDAKLAAALSFMRDATRGGLATVLCEIAMQRGLGVKIQESAIPVKEQVRGICELLGFDPLYVANEGKAVMVVRPQAAQQVLAVLKQHPLGKESAIIGEITAEHPKEVLLHTAIGGKRFVQLLSGQQLPRIC